MGGATVARVCTYRDTDEVTTSGSSHNHPHFLRSVIRWLQAGYPEGVPGPDRVPLLALLRSTPLTEDQIKEVGDATSPRRDPPRSPTARSTATRSRTFIKELTQHDAGPENVRRVAAKLAAAGWPLAGIDVSEVFRVMRTERQPRRLRRGSAPRITSRCR